MTRLLVFALVLGLLVAAVAWHLDPRYGARPTPPARVADPPGPAAPAADAPWPL